MLTIKKAFIFLLCIMATLALHSHAFANTQENKMVLDLNEIDLTQSFSKTETFSLPSGDLVTITNQFSPNPLTRGSETKDAVVGTWRAEMSYGVFSMSYRYDLSHPDGWEISNARDLSTTAAGGTVDDRSLSIGRATSTPSFPATLTGSAVVRFFDVGDIPPLTVTYNLRTSVSHDGKVTTQW